MASEFDQRIRPLATRLSNLFSRGVVKLVNDAKKMQLVQLVLQDTEVRELEYFQPFGFTSVPVDGAEAAVAFIGGRRDHGIVLSVADRRYRVVGLVDGEVAVYDKTGSKIILKASGDIEVRPSSGVVKFTGDVTVSGTLTATTDVVGGGKSLKTHTHAAGLLLTGASAGAAVTGTTGAPT